MMPTRTQDLADKIAAECNLANVKWEDPKLQAAVKRACKETVNFLRTNKRHYDAHGAEQNGAWFPDMPAANTKRQAHARPDALHDAIFENGLRHMFSELILAEKIDEKHWPNLEHAITYKTAAFHNELLRIHDAFPDEDIAVSLASLAKRFNYRSGGWRVRNKLFPVMADLGLWNIRRKGETNEWEIRLGKVADIFHDEVFYPVAIEFEAKMKGSEK
ncbi:hypothetical protein HJB80_08255 [Rhizobium lentis]|uniref:hypothetical protein n=1 Tax=Rhizobium lentis TaxID=1138194 RepID=UPI001C82EC68|nr:hypothetical protein [Rhizobium lentis]MBX5132649.1 hypothetical protein [Rhizobium lentis]